MLHVRNVFARTNAERALNKRCSFNCPRPRPRPSSYYSPSSPSGLLKMMGFFPPPSSPKLCEVSKKMAYKFDEHDALDLSRMIRRRRSDWTQQGIMKQLQVAAEAGASLGQVTSAAERTWMNPKAKTPAALNWPEHWEASTKEKALNMSGERLCSGCNPARKHPVSEMVRSSSGSWFCKACAE